MEETAKTRKYSAQEYLSNQGYGSGSNYISATVVALMIGFAKEHMLKLESVEEELSISNTQREGCKEELEVQRKLVLELQEKNRELKEDFKKLETSARQSINNTRNVLDEYRSTVSLLGSKALELEIKDLKIKEQGEEIESLRKGFELANNYIKESPCDPDICPKQLQAWTTFLEWKKIKGIEF